MARLDNSSRQKFLNYMNNQGGFSGDQFKQFQADEQGFAGGFPDFNKMGQQPVQPVQQTGPQVPVNPMPQQNNMGVRPLTKPTGGTDTSTGPTHLGSMPGVEDPGDGGVNVDPSVWDFFKQQGYDEQQMRNMLNGMGQPSYQDPSLQPRTGNNPYGPPNSITSRDPFFGRGRGAGGNSDPIFDDPEYGDDPFEGLPDDPNGNGGLGRNPLRNPGQWIDGQWVPDNPRQQPTNDVTFDQIGDMNGDGRVDLNDFLAYRTQQTTDTREGGGDNPGTPMRQDPTRRTATATQNPLLQQPGGQGGGNNGGLNYNGIDITDMNGDGKVDLNDFVAFRNRLTPGGNGGGQQPGGNGGGLPGQDAPGFGLDDILNGFQQALPGWMGTLLDRYQQGGQGGDSTATGGSASIGDINLQLPGLDKFQGGIDSILEALQNQEGQPGLGADALQLIMGGQLGGVQSGLDDIFSRLSRIEGNVGNGGGFDFGDLPALGINGNPLTKPAREAGTGVDTARELNSIDPSVITPEILNTVESTLMQRLGRPIEQDPRVAAQLADLDKSQSDRKAQRIEDLKRMGINADDGNYFSEGDKLGESFTRERLNLLANGENLRNTDLSTGLNLGNVQGGLNVNDARLGLSGNELGLRERLGLGGLQLNERGQNISQRGQDAQFDLSGARLGLDQLLGVGNLDVRRDEAQTRGKQLDAEIENARNARTQQNLANMIALLNGNSGKGLIDRGADLGKWIYGKVKKDD